MRLLIAADIFPPESGGPATYAVTLANELVKQGVGVTIVSLNPNSDVSKVNCDVFAVKSSFKPLRYWQYYKLLLKQGKNVDVIYAMGPVNAGYPAKCAAQKLKKKFVVKVVGDYAWEQGQVSGVVKDSIDDFQKKQCSGKIGRLQKVERKVVKSADRVIVPSKYLSEMVKGWGTLEEKISVIYNAVEFKSVMDKLSHPSERWIVSVGRLVPWKGMDTLIEAMPNVLVAVPNCRLKIVGDGPEMQNLKDKIKSLNLENTVELLGNLSHDKTLSHIQSADVFVLNSGYEGLSHVLLEALNSGAPVLASNVGGNPEVVRRQEDLFEFNNKQSVVKKILSSLASPVVNRMSEWVRDDRFYDNFMLSVMVSKTKEILEKVCAS